MSRAGMLIAIGCLVLAAGFSGVAAQESPSDPPVANVLVSRQLAARAHLAVGDAVTLAGDTAGTRAVRFRVAGVYEPTPDPMRFNVERLEVRLHLDDLMSLTADPDWDSPPVLTAYARLHGATNAGWNFLTGPRATIRKLAADDLKFVVAEKSPDQRDSANDLFIHSTRFVVVDRAGRIRGYYDGEAASARADVLKAVNRLLREKRP